MNKGFASVIGIALVALIVGGIAVLAYLQFKPPTPMIQPSPQSISSPTISAVPDETANWKTYTNNELGYSFQYPDNLKVVIPKIEGVPQINYTVVTDMTVNPNGNPNKGSTLFKKVGGIASTGGIVIYKGFWLRVETTGADSPTDVIENIISVNEKSTVINVDGKKGYKRVSTSEGGGYEGTDVWLDIIRDKKVYSIKGSYPSNVKKYSSLFEQMLSTFQFLD